MTIDDQLSELFQEKQRKEKVAVHIENIYRSIELKEAEIERLKDIVDKEEYDVLKLENNHLYSIFYTILGTHKEKLEKENQEYLQAFMKWQGEKSALQSLQEEKELLIKVFSGLKEVDKKYQRVLDQKIKILIEENNFPAPLAEYTKKIANYNIKIQELQNCINKGEVAKKYLNKASTGLTNLNAWGGKSAQHKKFKKTEKRVDKDILLANNFLQQFENRLIDLKTYFDLDYRREIVQFENFIDQFVDALITDWIVKHEIFNSNNLIINIADKITQLSEMLGYEIEKIETYIQEAKDAKADYIIKNLPS